MKNNFYVSTIEELIVFLEQKGGNHDYYYHYTTWDSFKKIYETKSFLLTRGNSLIINDQHECLMKGAYDIWNKTYIGSFCFGSSENMAMWGLYGIPKELAIRISIPKDTMKKWVLNIDKVYKWDNNCRGEMFTPKDISLTDVVYASGKERINLIRNNQKIEYGEITELDKNPLMTGRIKNDAWKYENEVRIKIELNDNCFFEKILVDIPQDTLDSMIITTGPNFVYNGDTLFNSLSDLGKVKKSGFTGLVNYRSLCSICKHGNFIRKN